MVAPVGAPLPLGLGEGKSQTKPRAQMRRENNLRCALVGSFTQNEGVHV